MNLFYNFNHLYNGLPNTYNAFTNLYSSDMHKKKEMYDNQISFCFHDPYIRIFITKLPNSQA